MSEKNFNREKCEQGICNHVMTWDRKSHYKIMTH